MFMTIWIANASIGLTTELARVTGTLSDPSAKVAALDQGGSPITYIFTQIFHLTNLTGLIVIAAIYAVGLYMTWSRYHKRLEKEWNNH